RWAGVCTAAAGAPANAERAGGAGGKRRGAECRRAAQGDLSHAQGEPAAGGADDASGSHRVPERYWADSDAAGITWCALDATIADQTGRARILGLGPRSRWPADPHP